MLLFYSVTRDYDLVVRVIVLDRGGQLFKMQPRGLSCIESQPPAGSRRAVRWGWWLDRVRWGFNTRVVSCGLVSILYRFIIITVVERVPNPSRDPSSHHSSAVRVH